MLDVQFLQASTGVGTGEFLAIAGAVGAPLTTVITVLFKAYQTAERERNAERLAERREHAENIRVMAVALHDASNALKEVADVMADLRPASGE